MILTFELKRTGGFFDSYLGGYSVAIMNLRGNEDFLNSNSE